MIKGTRPAMPLATSLLIPVFLLLTSCSTILTNTLIEPTVENLQKQPDLELVCDGAPAYLLMIDSLIASAPHNRNMLRVGSQAYSGYVAAIQECGLPESRVNAIADKGRRYGTSLLDQLLPVSPPADTGLLSVRLEQMQPRHVPDLFWGSLAWLNWIQTQHGAPAALADLALVEKIMGRVLDLNEQFQGGSPHLFFGALNATRPPMLGGDQEASRRHFERALALSDRSFLLVQTTYAETLGRQLFDRELHDALLQEVLNFPLDSAPEYTLSNQIAKRKARRLLDEQYFAE